MTQNKVQQRARAKRDAEKAARKRAEKMRKVRAGVASVVVIAVIVVAILTLAGGDDKKTSGRTPGDKKTGAKAACGGAARDKYEPKKYDAPPKMTIDTKKTYTATLDTSCGQITVALLDDTAPKTVNNFVFLARDGFYDQTIFHRVIKGFMAQGGDPLGTGTGDPGYKFEDEIKPTDKLDAPGILAMANSGPNTNGSQFFITEVPTPHLNGKHTIFGRVTKGLDVVKRIADVNKDGEKPNPPVVLYKVTIKES